MKFPKSKLDEMQEQQSAKIERLGLHLVMLALFLSSMVQMVICADEKQFLGEFCILMGACIYIIIGSLKIGVWDRHSRAKTKNILLISLAGSFTVAAFVLIIDTLYGPIHTICIDILIFSGSTFAFGFSGNLILRYIYRKRRQTLDSGAEYQELAAQVGITVQTLKAIENGSYNPSIQLCRKICRATGKSLDELFWKEKSLQL